MAAYDPERDLIVLTAMADQITSYLIEGELFWPLSGRLPGGMPHLTIGGFLLRQHRLTALRARLDDRQQARLDAALAAFRAARMEWRIHYFNKIVREWEMRVNLLQQFLNDCEAQEAANCFENWPTTARHRTILHHLQEALQEGGEGPSDQQRAELERLDGGLRRYLAQGEAGRFLWGADLAAVYPRNPYWWLWVVPPDDTLDPDR